MKLDCLLWSEFQDYLIFERNYKDNKNNLSAVKDRFEQIKMHFVDVEFDVENFRKYLKLLQQSGGKKKQGYAPATLNKFITVARRIEEFLGLNLNLKRFAYRPEKPEDFEALTVEETEKIAYCKIDYEKKSDFLNLRNKILYLLPGINGGNRINEALTLKWEDVWSAPKPHVIFRDTKSKKDRKVYLAPKLWQLMQQLPRNSQYVFTSYTGSEKPLWPQEINRDLKRRAELCGVERKNSKGENMIHYHLLRHTYATEMSENPDVSVMDLADVMGYKDPKTIQERYKKSSLSHNAEVIMSHPAQRGDKPTEMKIKQLTKALYRVIDPQTNPLSIVHTRDGKMVITIANLKDEDTSQMPSQSAK